MTNEQLINKLAAGFPEAQVTNYREMPTIKLNILRIYVVDTGDNYRVGVFLPAWIRALLIIVAFLAGLQISANRWIQMISVVVLFLGMYYLLIFIVKKKNKEVFERIESLLDKPIKISKL